jgi:outer membrane protein OmpA-like peptidoglycan-associated protein
MSSIRRVLIFLTLLALSIPAFSQEDPKDLAKLLYDQAVEILAATQALDQAREMYTQAADLDSTFVRANWEAGHILIRTIGKGRAVNYFKRVYRQDPDFRFDIEYWIGKSYQYDLQFDNALYYYNKYKEKLAKKPGFQGKDRTDPTTLDRSIKECETGKILMASPQSVSIVNIGKEINSEFDDFGPVLSEREDEIVFTSRRRDDNVNQNVYEDNLPYEDIYRAKKSGSSWAYAVNMGGKINTLYHESSLAMSADGNTLFIYIDTNGGDIFYCQRQSDGTWGEPIALPGIINSSFQEKSISISKDEKSLYFTSDRPGGLGGTDIYRASKDTKGQWSNVKNLGPRINTPLNDDGPFIGYDNITFYFSSQGHNGMGGYDIYKSTYDPQANDFSEPQNLGYPINTPDNEVYFITSADSKRAYYSSVREDGMGYTDIYVVTASQALNKTEPVVAKNPDPVKPKKDSVVVAKIDPPKQDPPKQDPPKQDPPKQDPPKQDPPKQDPPKIEPKKEPKVEPKKEPKVEPKKELKPLIYVVTVVDADGKAPLNAKIKLSGQRDNIIVPSTTSRPGVYEFKITNATAKDYRLSVEIDGYVFQNQNIKIAGASEQEKTLSRKIEMRKLAVGVTSILRNIYFDYDKARFQTESYTELNKLEAMLQQNANIKVEIGGHTDAYGKWDYNKQLSQKRAEAVKDYLTKKGIDPRRVKAVGYGETKPLASNDDEDDGRELNRRVEFRVLQN